MFSQIGPLEIILVLVIALVVFGPKRLPGLGKQLGTGMREFKDSISGITGDDDDDLDDDELTPKRKTALAAARDEAAGDEAPHDEVPRDEVPRDKAKAAVEEALGRPTRD